MLNRNQLNAFFILVPCLAFLLIFSPFSPLITPSFSKQKLSKINKKLRNEKQKAKKIRNELKSKKGKVKDALKKEKSIFSRIQRIQKEIKKKQKELKGFDKRISETQPKILNLSKEINLLVKKQDHKREYLNERLKTLYKQQYGENVRILISAKDQQDLIRKSKYISLLAYQDSKVLKNYRSEIKIIELKKTDMETLQKNLKENKRQANKKKKELEINRLRKDKLLATIKSKRSMYERTIKELEESSIKLKEMIKSLEKQKIPKSVRGKGFRALRGHLPWPLPGKVVVPFGKYKNPKFNITVFKNGIEIKTSLNDRPRAVAGGKVVYADWFKGYGLLLIINHGSGYHSLYGNLSEIFNKTGDIISEGNIIGKTGISRILNAPTLYFEIRHKGKPVNPLKWLKKKNRKSKRYK